MKPYFFGLDSYGNGTKPCIKRDCWYNQEGRCIYDIAPMKLEQSRSCHKSFQQAEIEDTIDYWHSMSSYIITKQKFDAAIQILMDNGIEENEAAIVLQALCYVLVDEETEQFMEE